VYDGPLSSSEVLQRHLGAAHVVKVFNNITFGHLRLLARPAGATDRSAPPIAGDDPITQAAVTAFLDSTGYDSLDADAWYWWPPLRVWQPRLRRTVRGLSDQRGTPADAAALRAVLGG
jgi:8-hydroxy-5-deazaflavin:NADPH oxidoreductase